MQTPLLFLLHLSCFQPNILLHLFRVSSHCLTIWKHTTRVRPFRRSKRPFSTGYHAEFDDADGVMHNVYFALAKAGWMCCAALRAHLAPRPGDHRKRRGPGVLSGAGSVAVRPLSLRAKKLEQFWQMLQTPRKSARKRRPDPSMREKPFPILRRAIASPTNTAKEGAVLIILDRFQFGQWCKEQVFCCVLRRTFAGLRTFVIDYLNEEVGPARDVTSASIFPAHRRCESSARSPSRTMPRLRFSARILSRPTIRPISRRAIRMGSMFFYANCFPIAQRSVRLPEKPLQRRLHALPVHQIA